MRKPPTRLVIDEESFRKARERPEGQEALNDLAGHIAETFVKSLPQDLVGPLGRWLKTAEGQTELRTRWPLIVDAYFNALCNPKRSDQPARVRRTRTRDE